MISCWKYRDAWNPFLQLLDLFWPEHPAPIVIVSDEFGSFDFKSRHHPLFYSHSGNWCSILESYARTKTSPILVMQEDFFLTRPVVDEIVEHGLQLLEANGAGCVRLYPSPVGTVDIGDAYFAEIPRGTPYRISCQAAIWDPDYLARIARVSSRTTGEAGDFENMGTPASDLEPEPILSLAREFQRPLDYLSSAITRGRWEPTAIELCAKHGIELDLSLRSSLPDLVR